MKKLVIVLLVLFAVPVMATEVTAIRAGQIIDPDSGKVAKNRIILIENDRIMDIVAKMPAGGVDKVIDLSGKWVLPGLMDMHSHLTANVPKGTSLVSDTLKKDAPYRALIGVKMSRDYLMAGFTTVRDVGNASEYADTAIRKAIAEGLFPGPRVYNAGKIISVLGGQSHDIAGERHGFWNQEYIDVVTADDMRRAIHTNIYYGARLIKLVVGDQAYSLSDEALRAAVDEADRAGMRVAMHAWGDEQTRRASNAGAITVEHGGGLQDEETYKTLAKNGTWLVGTEFPARYLEIYWNEERANIFYKVVVEQLRRAYKAGVNLAFGTDIIMTYQNEDRGEMAGNYLEAWIDAGIPPKDIIRAMTISGARVIGIEDHAGSITKGKWADIIAVDADPLADIKALKNVSFVMKGGQVYKQVRQP